MLNLRTFRLWLLTATVAALVTAPAFADAPVRIRGVVIRIANESITVKKRNGNIVTLKTVAGTAYAYVVPSSLDEIRVDDFVGSAVKGDPESLVAVELAIIPEDMRAGRISYYGWDPLPDPTATKAPRMTATHMTNGLVSTVSLAPKLASTNMTNGSVADNSCGAASCRLTVTYDGGRKRLHITVPSNAPIVRYVLADRSAVTIGCSVFIKVNPGDEAGLVTIGKGVTPPM